MAKVSIIIPVYNTSKYIKNCLDSILAQTMSDYEITSTLTAIDIKTKGKQ